MAQDHYYGKLLDVRLEAYTALADGEKSSSVGFDSIEAALMAGEEARSDQVVSQLSKFLNPVCKGLNDSIERPYRIAGAYGSSSVFDPKLIVVAGFWALPENLENALSPLAASSAVLESLDFVIDELNNRRSSVSKTFRNSRTKRLTTGQVFVSGSGVVGRATVPNNTMRLREGIRSDSTPLYVGNEARTKEDVESCVGLAIAQDVELASLCENRCTSLNQTVVVAGEDLAPYYADLKGLNMCMRAVLDRRGMRVSQSIQAEYSRKQAAFSDRLAHLRLMGRHMVQSVRGYLDKEHRIDGIIRNGQKVTSDFDERPLAILCVDYIHHYVGEIYDQAMDKDIDVVTLFPLLHPVNAPKTFKGQE